MKKKIIIWHKITLFLYFIFGIMPLMGQEITCTVLQSNSDGSFYIKIGNDTLIAKTREMIQKDLETIIDLETAQKNLAEKDSLIASYVRVENKYDLVYNQQKEYNLELEELLEGYKILAKGYKKETKDPLLTFSCGLGVSGSNSKPLILAGLNVKNRFNVWGLFQENNLGLVVGLNMPLF